MDNFPKIAILQQRMKQFGIEAYWVTAPENCYYLIDFRGQAVLDVSILVTLDSCTIISNTLYEEALGEHYEGAVHICRQPFGQELQLLCRDKQITQLWFEGRSLSAAQFLHLKQVSKVPLVQSGDLVERMRERKDREEIQLLQQACAITDAALVAVFKCLQVGMSEQEVAWMVERQIRELGSEDISFRPLIVAAGKHSAEPHHLPSEYRIATGDMVQFDIGARFQGYAADLSRVACAGAPGQEQLQVYQLVRRVQQFAIESITVGCQGAEIDRRCKEMIEKEGYAPYAHGLGHGVGLAPDVHEKPILSVRVSPAETQLENDMVFTIEPAIYLSGKFGVRIEDVVWMHEGRLQQLSKAPKDLYVF